MKGSNHGAIFNPKKLQFCAREVEYAGLVISDTGVKPPPELFQSIRAFPTPRNITDVRAWFGMVAQVAFAFSELPVMAPFRHLLSTRRRLRGPGSWRKRSNCQRKPLSGSVKQVSGTLTQGCLHVWPQTGVRWGSGSGCARNIVNARQTDLAVVTQAGRQPIWDPGSAAKQNRDMHLSQGRR